MAIKLTPQQKQILEKLRSYNVATHFEKVAKDMGLPPKGVQSQLGVLVKHELATVTDDNKYFQIAEDAEAKLEAEGEDTVVTMEDVNLTPKQYFQRIGRTWGINPERLQVMTDMIWQSGDSENLDHVWLSLGKAQVSPDIKRVWVSAWQAYLGQSNPEILNWQPPTIAQEKTAEAIEKKQIAHAVEEAEEEGPKEYIVDAKKLEPIKVGETMGLYSLKEAKEIIGMRWARDALMGNRTDAVASEKVSEIIAALAPLLSKEGKDSGEVMKVMRELFEEKLTSGLRELAAQIPQEGEKKPWWETLPSVLTAVTAAAPTIKTLLGVPDTEQLITAIVARLPQNTGSGQPLQAVNPDGTPVVFNKDLIEFWKFNAEQTREAEKHKQSMDMMAGVRDFIGKIGTAATRMAGERK